MGNRTREALTAELNELRLRAGEIEQALGQAPRDPPCSPSCAYLLDHETKSLRRANRALRLLAAIHDAMGRTDSAEALLEAVGRVCTEKGDFALAWIGFAQHDAARSVRIVSSFGRGAAYGARLDLTWDESGSGLGPSGRCIRSGKPVAVHCLETDPSFAPWREAARAYGLASMVALPLTLVDRTFGALSLYATEPEAFDHLEVEALHEVARAISTGHGAMLARQELRLAEDNAVQAELRFRGVAQHLCDVFWEVDARDGRILYLSPAFEAFWGVQRRPETFSDLAAHVHPDDVDTLGSAFPRVLAGEPTQTEYRVIRPDGTVQWVFDRTYPVRDANGDVVRILGNAADVTELRRKDLAIAASKRHLEAVLDSLTEQIAVIDEHGVITSVNEAWRGFGAQSGSPLAHDGVGCSYLAVLDGAVGADLDHEGSAMATGIRAVLAGELERYATSYDCFVQGSAKRTFAMHVTRFLDERGSPHAVIAHREETERRNADQAVRASEERLRRMVDDGWDVIILSGADNRIQYVSGSVTRVLGYTVDEFKALEGAQLHPPDARAAMEARTAHFRGSPGKVSVVPLRMRHKQGHYVWMEVVATNLLDDPAVRAVVSNARDITAHKRAQEKLQQLNDELEARVGRRTRELTVLYEQAPCGYHSVDADGRVTRMNETELRWLGHAREDVVGVRRFEELVAPDHLDALRETVGSLSTARAAGEVEVELVRKDGTRLWVLLSVLRDADSPDELRMTVHDRTVRRRAEQAVRRSRDDLSAANAALKVAAMAKDEFLASMSHELRTPLNSILGLSEAFQEGIYGELPDPQRHGLQRIEESGRHLLALINDILDLSKIQAGQLELDKHPTPLDDLCRASLRQLHVAAQKKRIGVAYRIDDELVMMVADGRRVKQILINLLGNAVKFTPEGGSIGLEAATSPDGETVSFTVWDTGIGIAAGDQPRIFRPFVQLDSSLARRHEGTGLGLALVRRLVELHGGGLHVESVVGEGSRFTVVLPWERPPSGKSDPTPDAPILAERWGVPGQRAIHVLLAEDDATNVTVVSDFLLAHGFELTVARNGFEALTLAHERVPDLVLMDIQMPVLDGISALRELRRSPDEAVRAVPVIAVTALAMPGDEERCREAGADAYLTKPLALRRLLDAIRERVPKPRTSKPPTS